MPITPDSLKDILVEPGYITAEAFAALSKKAEAEGRPLTELFVEDGLIKDSELGTLIARAYDVSFIDLTTAHIDDTLLRIVPEVMAKGSGVVAFERSDKGVKVAFLDPTDLITVRLLEKRFEAPVMPYLMTARGLEHALTHYDESLIGVFTEQLDTLKDTSISQSERDDITINIVDLLLQYGHSNDASDIHIEPYETKVVVRFRIDGVMHDVLEIPKELSEVIITRIKVLAKMRTDEHRAAQDGKFRFAVTLGKGVSAKTVGKEAVKEPVDIRVSIVPVTKGENVVLRLLAAKSRRFDLTDLGLSESDLVKVRKGIEHPHGMILVTGPTGSGKTTTLYGILKILNKREVHISTIEDPVEYDIEGVSQIQVDPKTNLTFAQGLRSIVRQDPDIIMVGEIRDKETAGIAINSAMTGHLVLSTIHANDSATTLPRLLDMEVEPYLVASTVRFVIAQRLVRKVCKNCVASHHPTEEELRLIEGEPAVKELLTTRSKNLNKLLFFKGVGCDACGGTGYNGRIGLFEVLEMSEKFRDLIMARSNSDTIMDLAREEGMTTMLEDGIDKVFSGTTTLEEVLRVTRT